MGNLCHQAIEGREDIDHSRFGEILLMWLFVYIHQGGMLPKSLYDNRCTINENTLINRS
jgi:hypothetical protein